MRVQIIGLILLASTAAPALVQAQPRDSVERRVGRLEQQLRAVQRRVFPNGNVPVEPEISPETGPAQPVGAPGSDAITSLTQRVDALETQLRALTGQIEENGYRTRQLEEQVARLRTDLTARIDRLEPPPSATPGRTEPAADAAADEPAEPASRPSRAAADVPASAEEAYNAGFRLWDQRRYAEAQAALEAAAERYPTGRWISWTRNLLGRAYLDDGKPATAARILLANYQENPRGERAADSLFFLGQALTRLNRRTEACRVYDELARVYPDVREQIGSQIPQARRAARCAN